MLEISNISINLLFRPKLSKNNYNCTVPIAWFYLTMLQYITTFFKSVNSC